MVCGGLAGRGVWGTVYGCPLAVHVELSHTANWLYPVQNRRFKKHTPQCVKSARSPVRLDAQAWRMPGCGRPAPSDAATRLHTDIYLGQDGPVGPQSSPGAVRPEPAESQAQLSLSQPPPRSESPGSSPSKARPVRPVGRRHRGGQHPKRGNAAVCAWGNDTLRPDSPHLLTKAWPCTGAASHTGGH